MGPPGPIHRNDAMTVHERQIIHGQPPSKSNEKKIIYFGGHASIANTKNQKEYEKSFFMQCSLRRKNISSRFKLTVDVYFRSDRSDLDNAMKIILDCLQSCGAIKNDRLCAEIHARKLIDKIDPRIEFEIEELI